MKKIITNKSKILNVYLLHYHYPFVVTGKVVLKLFFILTCIFFLNTNSFANTSAVILQYHHVSEHTPPSTSISPEKFKAHIQWIKDNEFQVLTLSEIVQTLQNKKELAHSKVLAITFDDANRSVCENAWPILKKHKLPFTLFISTEALEKNYQSQCSWAALKEMYESGLMTPANHSHQHLNMISSSILKKKEWAKLMSDELVKAQDLIEQKIGYASMLFAYPFGEYNHALTTLITQLGFTGFGQHSGAIGHQSDFSALPRFPASGQFANLESLSTKLYSLAFPANVLASTDNPVIFNGENNPPYLTISFPEKNLLTTTNCYNSSGQSLPVKIESNSLIVQSASKLEPGRHRYTCTSKSNIPDRFYWYSHQWLIE
tara:strand:- start:6728 stop:7849 length:1122 start_codon:yes stop_codon:yes gene_type:complete